jgi:hypothetical protein
VLAGVVVVESVAWEQIISNAKKSDIVGRRKRDIVGRSCLEISLVKKICVFII